MITVNMEFYTLKEKTPDNNTDCLVIFTRGDDAQSCHYKDNNFRIYKQGEWVVCKGLVLLWAPVLTKEKALSSDPIIKNILSSRINQVKQILHFDGVTLKIMYIEVISEDKWHIGYKEYYPFTEGTPFVSDVTNPIFQYFVNTNQLLNEYFKFNLGFCKDNND